MSLAIDKGRHKFDYIEVLGARTHNLKNIDLRFPRNQLVVLTGVSGSGKSSLAFDTIYAEGQRRYRESFSAYARNFLENITRPEVDAINGLSPVIAIEQKTTHSHARSTVGTFTEIYDFMRLLFARIADAHDHCSSNKMVVQNEDQLFTDLLNMYAGQSVTLMAPLVSGKKGHFGELFNRLIRLGFHKISLDGTIKELDDSLTLARYKKHDIALVVDHVIVTKPNQDRMKHSLQLALLHGKGRVKVVDAAHQSRYFSTSLVDVETGCAYDAPEPSLFSFNTAHGACPTCAGLGEKIQVDIDSIIPDKTKSIYQGAILPLGAHKSSILFKKITTLLAFYRHQITDPVETLPLPLLHLLLLGNTVQSATNKGLDYVEPFPGVIPTLIKEQEREGSVTSSMGTIFEAVCPDCAGSRLNKVARSFKIKERTIAELASMELDKLQAWFTQLPASLTERQQQIAQELIKEISKRLQFLIDVGLHYLQLNRSLKTLSGGEAQRVRLATQMGIQLLGVCYILDEPSIGLHQRDNSRLIAALKTLRDMGNTLLVVEHDRETMLEADYLIEIGPQAGLYGGLVVAAGSLPEFLMQDSVTAEFLNRKRDFPFSATRKKGNGNAITLMGCSGHNLKNITVTIPLGMMVCITGVSGSGKSSLIHKTLLPILQRKLYNSPVVPLDYKEATGLVHINKVIEVNQAPIGRTHRSNPATYTTIFTEIRNFFALLPEAQIQGYKPNRFSFNIKEGRCNSCEGIGHQRIEMGLLPEIYVTCASCKGKRYNRETLAVRYKGKSIADVLDMTVEDAFSFFKNHATICSKLHTLMQVGLGYITLGQHATTLSGGEAQRMKLATELTQKSSRDTLYILDEPTTGLHFQDIVDLLSVLQKLVEQGNTVLVIEHNVDMIKVADYVIDLGPEGGDAGGYVVAVGTPEEVALAQASHTGYFLRKELEIIHKS
ncbi:excinuclease ABC subunit UvrA [Candidatus Cardinium hertigii]|uniref:UvrABC system protein A n=1 Tax=Candidatus Cardinium hertigii TaxID=247481 RepID=A0A2Z3L6P9_9BACT|nr:excinuclease ABC subunit UvrA [Candidatus Cardinium hertigii]AWN81377.1 UvrABC system protein A [Candidatus Cardinium hertigii]